MRKHRDVLQQASRLAVAVALCIAAMLAVYALTGHFTNAVLLGALIGFVMAMGNFLSLSITVSNAMNRMQSSSMTTNDETVVCVMPMPPNNGMVK